MSDNDIPEEVKDRIQTDYSSKKDKKSGVDPSRPKEKLSQVIEGEIIRKKPSTMNRIREAFTGDDARTIGDYILYEVIIPATKNMIFDVFVQGAERSLYGEVRRSSSSRYSSQGKTSYEKMYGRSNRDRESRDRPSERRELSSRARRTHDFLEIIFKTRADAEETLDQLQERIERYEVATVSDFYTLVGETSDFPDEQWGWSNLSDAKILHVRGGYLLDLPRTERVD